MPNKKTLQIARFLFFYFLDLRFNSIKHKLQIITLFIEFSSQKWWNVSIINLDV
jgi:hypothetical protein